MNASSKIKNSIIAIIISLCIILGAIFGIIFAPKINNVKAEYDYGEFNEEKGYYVKDGVVFYGVKVTFNDGFDVSENKFKLSEEEGAVVYTIGFDENSNPTTVTWTGNESTTIINGEFFVLGEQIYSLTENLSKVINVNGRVIDVDDKNFSLNQVNYTIDASSVTWTEDEEKTTPITNNEFTLGGKQYYYSESENKIIEVSYWPAYNTVVTDLNGNPETVKFGEAVLLEENEAILIAFARQTNDESGLVSNGTEIISAKVDYLNAVSVKINGESKGDEIENNFSQSADEVVKEFGYLIDPNGIAPTSQKSGVNSGKEGKVEFFVKEFECDGELSNFSFMFYVFKEGTYQRTENLNPGFVRPNTEIVANNYVVDATTRQQYFSEHFYFYADQKLPYLEFDSNRYEVSITKTIHKTSTSYSFNINNGATNNQTTGINKKLTTVVDQLENGNKVSQTITQDLSTLDIYARALRVEDKGNGIVRVYFEDLGDYTFSYSAIYYETDGSKTVLENLNTDSRQDKLSIFGTELTYTDFEKGQLPFRNENNTVYADLTGILTFGTSGNNRFETTITEGDKEVGKLTLSNDVVIASTNQPAVELLFNSKVTESGFEVWHSSNGTDFTKDTAYSYTSDFTAPGYYVVKVVGTFEGYKEWGAANTTVAKTLTTTQYYVFQIKAQTSNLELYVLDESGTPTNQKVYTNTFVKNGIEIKDFQATSDFDSAVYFEITKKGFNQTASQAQTIKLPTARFDELSAGEIQTLANFGITKYNGHYILKPTEGSSVDGEYSVSLCFGKSGKETINFKLDTEEISGIEAYFAESIYGSQLYRTSLISGQNQIALTNKSFALFWNEKASGAKISTSYVRFGIGEKQFNETPSNYILNNAWLAADYSIVLNEANAKATYEKAVSINEVRENSVISASGLYIFKLEDEAGHVSYYSVLVDDSVPTILIKPTTSGVSSYLKATGVNNVTEATTIMFGTHKAISVNVLEVVDNQNKEVAVVKNKTWDGQTTASEYLKAFFENLDKIDSKGVVSTANENYFFAIPIVSVYEKVGSLTTKIELSEEGEYLRKTILNEDGKLQEAEFIYQVFDASNSSKNIPSKQIAVGFNTDQTGLTIYTEAGNIDSALSLVETKTLISNTYTERIKYFSATTEDIIYLTWDTFFPKNQNFFVDVTNGGLTCEFYELIYNSEKKTYEYSTIGSTVSLSAKVGNTIKPLTELTEEEVKNGSAIEIEINVVNQKTQAGKYVITRTYSAINSSLPVDYGDDFETVKTVVFVDRNNIISAPNVKGENVGEFSYLTTFDGGEDEDKEYFNELYRQSQTSENYVLQTNQLPIGFYIPNAKYGTVYSAANSQLTLADIQDLITEDYIFSNSVLFENLDINSSLGRNGTFSPFKLNVVLKSPLVEIDGQQDYVYYYYSQIGNTGYYKINGYSFGELAPDESPIPLTETSFVNFNPFSKNDKKEYEEGNYILEIGCIETKTNSYYQNFRVVVNVVTSEPDFSLTAKYPDLQNMDDREIQSDGNHYYTNTNTIVVSWKESSNSFLTNIDKNSISYSYFVDGEITTVSINPDIDIKEDLNELYFTIQLPEKATSLKILMTYEVYGTSREYTVYYPSAVKEEKTVVFDRKAPTNSISVLQNGDETVKGLSVDLLRETSDRFSKSKTSGIFQYYTFVGDETYLKTLAGLLEENEPTEAKVFYFRNIIGDKYSNIYQETGLGLDSSSVASNLFSESYATLNGWIKVEGKQSIENLSGYYEVVELDLAGNMTIYSIYIGSSRAFEANINGNNVVKFETQEKEYSTVDKAIIDNFNITSNYKYLKLTIDGKNYYITPQNFSTVTTENGEVVVCTSVFDSDGTKKELSSLEFKAQATAHKVVFYDTISKKEYSLTLNVIDSDSLLTNDGGATVVSNVNVLNEQNETISSSNLALRIETPSDSSLKIDEDSLRIFQIKADGTIVEYSLGNNELLKFKPNSLSSEITYYYIEKNLDFETSTFYIVYKDNFEREYNELVEYNKASFNRFEGNYDVSSNIQNKNEILVSGNIDVNISNLFDVEIEVENTSGNPISGGYQTIGASSLGGSYTKYRLFASTEKTNAYFGGLRTFTLTISYNIPEQILNILRSDELGYDNLINNNDGVIEKIVVKIFNQMPNVIITDMNGANITDKLFNKEINQSDEINLSFASQSELANKLGITSKVFLRLRSGEEGYLELSSPTSISKAGVYDVYVQNFDSQGNALDFVIKNDFVISNLDVMFYSVVKINKDNEIELVSPTGKAFEYDKENGLFASKHYIVNTNDYQVITNGVNVGAQILGTYNGTTVYRIESVSGTIYKTTIAVTVVNETNDILAGNKFIYYLGTSYTVPSDTNYITSSNKDIYLTKEDIYDEITLRWASYYAIPENKINCYVSSNDGETWNKVDATDDGEVSTIILNKSSNYLFKFEDLAGNVQLFSSPSGFKSTTTKINFIRSVVFDVNGKTPIDNAVYNEEVVITLPTNLTHFYSTTPVIHVLRNNEEYSVSRNANGEYVFSETGYYTVYFSTKVESGTKELNEDILTFSIIDQNDSRWAFNYVNYNNYNVKSIKLNGVEISDELKANALSVQQEINISAFNKDELGNPYFSNGIYTILIEYEDDVLGVQTFEFDFWLNMANPPISVSLQEGSSTKGTVTVTYNKTNLFNTLGECYIKVGSTIIEITEDSISDNGETLTISSAGNHYIQVYTKSGKLVYSYNVNIDKPLDTVTIVLIVVGCVVAVGGILTFILLRKKLKVR